MKFVFSAIMLFFSFSAVAQNEKSHDDRRIADEQVNRQIDDVLVPQPETVALPQNGQREAVALTGEQLQQHPDLIVRALLAALLQNHVEHTALLLPHYRKLPSHQRETGLEIWAQAVLARGEGKSTEAVRLYRQVLAQQPEWAAVRLQTAAALLDNKEWEAAEAQLRQLQSEAGLPQALAVEIGQILTQVQRQSRWQFHGGFTAINDKNINNAPKNPDLGGGWRGETAESGQGLAVNLGTGKKWFWQGGVFNELRLDGSSKYYWNNKRFNEANVRASVGVGYQNAKNSVVLLPFVEQMWYSGGKQGNEALRRFSHGQGLTLEASHTFSPKWQGSLNAETVRNRYRTRAHLNGNTHFVSLSAVYQHNPRQAWFGGVDWHGNNARDGDDSFVRKGFRTGWIQEWRGLSTRLSASYGWKNYRSAGFFNQIQRNRELGIQASVWHRAVHWRGLTPRLTWSYVRTRSNIPLFSYDKQRLFVEISKQF